MTDRDIIIVNEGLHWLSANRNEHARLQASFDGMCFGDWRARMATIWECSAI
jgi:hypothetical protein